MRSLLFTLIMTLVPVSVPTLCWGLTDAEAINVSGRQRMLSQRMMKNYLMIGSEVKADEAQRQLDSAVALFEEQFLALRDYAPTAEINKQLDEVEDIWLNHRVKIISTPEKKDAPELMEENLKLLTACNDVVKAIEVHSGIASGKLVNMSGRQRMLSQKIAKTYMAMYWNVDAPTLADEFNQAIDLFDDSLTELQSSDKNDGPLKNALTRARNQWKFSQSGFGLGDEGRYVPTVISVTTESILRKMDQITGQYEALMNADQLVAGTD
ncbi:type IV pili methyl-accepting chemotaxis transducer N-terminal domain-containing protein [uncultured Thalassolituus sp.]|uniref:type IV pili methyl-accepting chemotaxis transducer N-terminal domain-containing protein n=1 Tax=uncultured Thalassolituus sp. TaxID=285273 RepID=UPI00261AE61C|nr:type IV pili methyl-accepting chemotaxis transducer N-terminal domain-containing protein [uncultured Thalassolituus sp.]